MKRIKILGPLMEPIQFVATGIRLFYNRSIIPNPLDMGQQELKCPSRLHEQNKHPLPFIPPSLSLSESESAAC